MSISEFVVGFGTAWLPLDKTAFLLLNYQFLAKEVVHG